MATPVFLILPGATADAERFAACRDLAAECWPEADVRMPNYLSRFRGLAGVGRWLDRYAGRALTEPAPVFVLAYILGGAALPFAPALHARIGRLVVLRSRYQEAVARALRARFGAWGSALLFGKSVADLGREGFWPPGFQPRCPALTIVETRPSRQAAVLKVAPLSDVALGIAAYTELPINHDIAYHSRSLMQTATQWLRQPR